MSGTEVAMVDAIKVAMSIGGFMLALVGGAIARDRVISSRLSDGLSKVHGKVDDLKDEINNSFARKDDVRESVRRVERGIEALGTEMRQNHKDLTALIVKEIKE